METISWGSSLKEVTNIDVLRDLTQDMANAIAVGPQNKFFQELESFNNVLEHYGIDSIDVTDKWNWRPGTYNKIDEFLVKKLKVHKKSKGIHHKLERTKDESNYLNYIIRQARQLEIDKYYLKQDGYPRNVNIDDFKEETIKLVNTINTQCDLAYNLSNGKVEIKPYITVQKEIRQTQLLYEIHLRDINILVYDGKKDAKLIQRIESEKDSYIRIVASKNLREHIGGTSKGFGMNGCYHSSLGKHLKHPYISARSSYNDYGAVCLSSYQDDIYNSFKKNDFTSLQYHLLSWAQYYHNQYSHPYNKIQYFHIGMPDNFSKEYKALGSQEYINSCSRSMHTKYNVDKDINNSLSLLKACEEVNCSAMNSCKVNLDAVYTLDKYQDSEYKYQMESYFGALIECYGNWAFYDIKTKFEEITGLHPLCEYDYNVSEEMNKEHLYHSIWLILFKRGLANDYIEFGLQSIKYYGEEVKAEEDIKDKMMKWATSPGRSE